MRNLKNIRWMAGLVLALLVTTAMSTAARADMYLVGFGMFIADGTTGADIGVNARRSTNPNDYPGGYLSGGDLHVVSGATGADQHVSISFQLAVGANVFQVPHHDQAGAEGLTIMLNSTGTTYNPANGPDIAGDLDVFSPALGSSLFSAQANGVLVQNYAGYDGASWYAPYSGATAFTIGSEQVTVTAFQAATANTFGGPNNLDSFTLTVTDLPEPASLGLLVLGGTMLLLRRRRVV